MRTLLKTLLSVFAFLFLDAGVAAPICSKVFTEAVQLKEAPMDSLKVAAVQYPLGERSSPEKFLKKMDSYLVQAKEKRAQLVVFPELVTLELADWNLPAKPQLQKIAVEFTPLYIDWLIKRAKELNISILGGTTPQMRGQEIYNVAVMVFASGKVILQDKIFLTPDEKGWNWTPGKTLKVFETPWGRSTITTCFDCEFPRISNLLVEASPEVILVPSWTSTSSGFNRVDWTSKARAIEHFAYTIKTGTVPDPSSNEPHFGQATIVSPQDQGFPTTIAAGTMNTNQIIYGELNLKKLREDRQTTGYSPAKEQTNRAEPIDFKIEN